MMALNDWTPEQIANVLRYGVCTICGAPRKTEMVTVYTSGDKSATVEHRMVCENGHESR